ncbi:MAG: small ribosomal subunit Rsm22 family protein [bacterium]|nr:small ribosomal subunit Rsm22 family protein [bacterium]
MNLETIIQDFLIDRYYLPARGRKPDRFPVRFFEEGIETLNRSFTSERGQLPKNYFNLKELRSAYIAYFMLVNTLKVPSLLREIPKEFWKKEKIKVLDLGSGPGTGILGTLLQAANLTPSPSFSFTAIDQNLPILKDAMELHHRIKSLLNISSRLRIEVLDLVREPLAKKLKQEKFDLILMVNTLNEFFDPEKRVHLLTRLLNHQLAEGGKIRIVEPALRKTTRELMELHDALLEKQVAVIEAPCLHQKACPMLKESGRDWCHTYLEWQRPKLIEDFDKRVGIRKDYLKCSYLILSSPSPQPSPQGEREQKKESPPQFGGRAREGGSLQYRAVSSLMGENGKAKVVLCGGKGESLLHTERLNKDRSDKNACFDELKRGDLVEMPSVERISKETKLRKV